MVSSLNNLAVLLENQARNYIFFMFSRETISRNLLGAAPDDFVYSPAKSYVCRVPKSAKVYWQYILAYFCACILLSAVYGVSATVLREKARMHTLHPKNVA